MQRTMSSSRPSIALTPHCGSASQERPIATRSTSPSRSISSAWSGVRVTETPITGMATAFLTAAIIGLRQPCGVLIGSMMVCIVS